MQVKTQMNGSYSAKYFLIHPDDLIEPYDLTLKSMSYRKKEWAIRVYQMLQPLLSTEDNITFRWTGLSKLFDSITATRWIYQNIPMEGLRMANKKVGL